MTTAAFGIQPAPEWAETYASWAVSGYYNTDLGSYMLKHPGVIDVVLKFRQSQEGEAFRRETKDKLLQDRASEFTISVNAGLARNIPHDVFQRAQDRLSVLMMADVKTTRIPAVWGNSRHSDDSTGLWRLKSRRTLLDLCEAREIKKGDPCICGSGDKLRLCCLAPLKS
jgi:hypothetical protein